MQYSNKAEAWKIVGGLSDPSKMPCKGYSLPAQECMIGSKLRDIEGSVCSSCYALKGRYTFPNVKSAMYRRFETLYSPQWVSAMTYLIKDMPYFRWHDSGDLQNVLHLDKICQVAKNCPNTKFWLPTREMRIITTYCKSNLIPSNLCIRVSGAMIDGPAPLKMARECGVQVSEVRTKKWTCPASTQNNECKDCRKCWSTSMMNVSYRKH